MEDAYLVERMLGIVSAHGGFDRSAAAAAIETTLGIIAGFVDEQTAGALAAELPQRFRAALERGPAPPPLPPGRAREENAVVCRALAELLPDEVLDPLRAAVPAEWAGWLSPPAPPDEPHPHVHVGPRGTLADGRPGSRHPISEARPDKAHAHSVARSDDPHGDTKLSSAGDPREEVGETVAAGRPWSHRPLSESEE